MQTFTDLEIESFPATDLAPDKPADAPEILLNREFGNSFSKIYLYRITWSGKKAAISRAQTVALSRTYQSPNGASLQGRALSTRPRRKNMCRRGPAHHVRLMRMAEVSFPAMGPRTPGRTPMREYSGVKSGPATGLLTGGGSSRHLRLTTSPFTGGGRHWL